MIIEGRKYTSQKKFELKNSYTTVQFDYDKIAYLIPKLKGSLEEIIASYKINNALMVEYQEVYAILDVASTGESTNYNYNYGNRIGIWSTFHSKMYHITNNKATTIPNACSICKHKLRGIVGECKEKYPYNATFREVCKWDFTKYYNDNDLSVDFSSGYFITARRVNRDNAFVQHTGVNDIDYSQETFDKNKAKYKIKARAIKLKKAKLEKHCTRCIFSCEHKLIKSENVQNHCCLTYEQALKSEFFKDIKLINSTSMYRQGVRLPNVYNVSGYSNWYNEGIKKIALHETKYQKEEKE